MHLLFMVYSSTPFSADFLLVNMIPCHFHKYVKVSSPVRFFCSVASFDYCFDIVYVENLLVNFC